MGTDAAGFGLLLDNRVLTPKSMRGFLSYEAMSHSSRCAMPCVDWMRFEILK